MSETPPTPAKPPAINLPGLPGRAWQMIWPVGPLFVMAIFGALLGGLNRVQSGASSVNWLAAQIIPTGGMADLENMLILVDWLMQPVVLGRLLGGMLALGLVAMLFGSAMEAGLIAGVAGRMVGRTPGLGDLLLAGVQRMWPVFWLKLLIGVSWVVPMVVGMLSTFVAIFAATMQVADAADFAEAVSGTRLLTAGVILVVCLGLLLVVFTVVSIVFAWIEVLAVRVAVLEGRGVVGSFRRAWQILRANFGWFVVLWVIMFAGEYIAAYILSLPLRFLGSVAMPAIDLAAVVSGGMPPSNATLAAAGAISLFFALVAAVPGGILHLYLSSVWTVAYGDLVGGVPGGEEHDAASDPTTSV